MAGSLRRLEDASKSRRLDEWLKPGPEPTRLKASIFPKRSLSELMDLYDIPR